jgi:hypothetical protein
MGIISTFRILLIAVFALLPSFAFSLDAAVESFRIEQNKIHPQALIGIQGIITITFSELNYYIEMDVEPAKIQTYTSHDGARGKAQQLVLTPDNTKALSGIDYSGMVIRRFPVVRVGTSIVEIIYDMEKNLRAWIMIDDHEYVRTNIGQLVEAKILFFDDAQNLNVSFDLFYLLNGFPRTFYEAADETSKKVVISNAGAFNNITWRMRKETVSSVVITEMLNGFAKVYTAQGADGELLFAGWVKIFVDEKLTIWQFEMGGC